MSFQSEYRLIRMRPRATSLGWPLIVLFGCAFLLAAFANRLPEPWMQNALYAATGSIAVLFWLFPLLRYVTSYLEITNTRVIARLGIFGQKSFDLNLADLANVRQIAGSKLSISSKSGEEYTFGPVSRSKLIAAEIAKLANTNVLEQP